MLAPKRIKYRKKHKGKMRGVSRRGVPTGSADSSWNEDFHQSSGGYTNGYGGAPGRKRHIAPLKTH